MTKKANHPSPETESTPATADDTEETSVEPVVAAGDEELDAEQQKAFESIMAQIEGGNADSGDADAVSEDDFAAELGKVAKAADDAEDATVSETPRSSDDEELDAEQQKAFESIMAQIEGGDADSGDAGDSGEPDAADLPEDDFAAELEKVAKAADEAEDATVSETPRSAEDEELDAEQQKAFESIMAQIEGDNADSGDAGDSGETDAEAAPEDDFAAELEKVAKAADDVEEATASETPGSSDDEELDAEQQKAFESIMAQIGEDDEEQKAKVGDPAEPAHDDPEETVVDPPDSPAADTDVSSDDIEAILNEIAADDEGPTVSPADASTAADPPEKTEPSAEITTAEPSGGEKIAAADASDPPAKPETSPTETATPPETAAVAFRPADDRPRPLPAAPSPTTDKKRSSLRRWIVATLALSLMAAVGLAAFHFRPSAGSGKTVLPPPVNDAADTAAVQPEPVAAAAAPPTPAPSRPQPVQNSALTATVDALNRLREQLTAKQHEIEELRDYYRSGIDAEMNAIVEAIRQAGKGKPSYTVAMAEPRISLGLSAIQRRRTYIQKLASPEKSLYQGSESLLYLIRKAELLGMMANKTSDIDIDGFVDQAQTAMATQDAVLERLNIDAVAASPPSLASIWQEVEDRLSQKTAMADNAAADPDNAAIWEAICAGDFSGRDRLTALSAKAADCLAKWKGKDLFLDTLTHLDPDAAAALSHWNGEWLALNGLTELSPEVAEHLVHWKGRGLSLNGLTRLSPRVVAILSEWQGAQIELVHVKHTVHWDNPNTRLFFSEALQRKQEQKRN